MITGAGADGRAILVVAARRADAADAEHILLARQVGVPAIVVFPEPSCDMVEDAELLELVELEVRNC